MAYDDELAERIRALIGDESVREQRMFGGLSFLVGGNMALALSGHGALLVRVDHAEIDALIAANSAADVAMMGTRRMRGWVEVRPAGIATDDDLAPWVRRGVASATALPAK